MNAVFILVAVERVFNVLIQQKLTLHYTLIKLHQALKELNTLKHNNSKSLNKKTNTKKIGCIRIRIEDPALDADEFSTKMISDSYYMQEVIKLLKTSPDSCVEVSYEIES